MFNTIVWEIWFFIFNVIALVGIPVLIYIAAGYATFFLYIRYNLDVDVKDKSDVVFIWPIILFKVGMDIIEIKAKQLKLVVVSSRSFRKIHPEQQNR